MYTYGNVKDGGFFVADGIPYRSLPESETEDGTKFNAVATARNDGEVSFDVLRHFEEDETVDDIPLRWDRIEPLDLEPVFQEFVGVIEALETDAETEIEDEGYEKLQEMWAKDASDLRYVLEEAREGRWSTAWKSMRRLDTAVRDRVPREMYEELYERGHDG